MISLLNKIKQLLRTRRINVFFVFFIIAFSILIINKLSKTYINTLRFKVEIVSIPEDIILRNLNEVTIPVQFENTGFNWIRFVFKQPKITLDLKEDFSVKDSYFAYSVTKGKIIKKLPKYSKNIEVSLDTLKLKFDKLASKKVPVVSDVVISYAPGINSFEGLIFTPNSVTVVGSETEVNKIEKIKTSQIVLESVIKPLNKTISLELDSLPSSISVMDKTVEAKLDVQQFTEGQLKIPITLKNKPDEVTITFFPKQVTVSYYLPLKDFKSVTKTSFNAVLDYKTITLTNNYVYPELKVLTDKVKSARIKESKIEYIITK